MKIHLKTIVAIATLLMIAAAGASASDERAVDKITFPALNKFETPDVSKHQLSNGLQVYLLEDHSLPMFHASVRIAAGSYLEPADKVGLAKVLAEALRTGGTSKWTGDEIDEKLEAVGASVETSMDRTSGSASANSLIEFSDMTLDVLAEVLRNPTFDQDKIDLAKTQYRGGISRRNDNPQQIASQVFRAAIYGEDSPYARVMEYATLDAISREDLQAFHQKYIHPANLQIAVWGDFDEKKMLAKLEERFGSWSSDGVKSPAPPEVEDHWGSRVKYVEKNDVNQSNIYIGHLGGKVQDDDYATRLVMNNIFGEGFGSRLFNNVRSRKGLAYATGGGYRSNIDYPGRFFGFASTKSETTLQAINETIKQIKSMHTDLPTEQEMTVAIDGYLNSFVFNFEDRANVIKRMVEYDAQGLPADFLSQLKDKVEKITPEQVQEVARKRLNPEQMYIVVVGKGEDFDGSLAELGLPIDTVDITIPSGEPESEIDMSPENLAKGQEILAAAVQASGGKENFKKIKSFKSESMLTLSMGGREMALQVSSLFELPGKRFQTVNTPMGAMVEVFDGTQGWNTGRGETTSLPETDVEKTRKSIARNLLVLLATVGSSDYSPVYAGTGDVDGVSVEYIYLVDSDGNELSKIACDAATHLPVSQSFFGQTMAGPANLDVYYSDYREVSGVKTPFSIKTLSAGEPYLDVTVGEIILNADIPADAFTRPE